MNNKLTRLLLVSSLVAANTIAIMPASMASNIVQTKQTKANNSKIVEDNNFRFQIQSCLRKGSTVNCGVLITNLDSEDRKIAFFTTEEPYDFKITPPRIIDIEGNEYSPETIQIGSDKAFGGGLYKRIDKRLIRGIPTKVNLNFSVPPTVSKLAVIEVNYLLDVGNNKTEPFKGELRDVEIAGATSTPTTPQRRRKK